MQFSNESITQIVQGKKTQTRRLAKQDERFNIEPGHGPINAVITSKYITRWQIGRTYAVQPGRGKKGIWWCPKCKITFYAGNKEFSKIVSCHRCTQRLEPLRIRITNIEKQTLYNSKDDGWLQEGYETKREFWNAFCRINRIEQDDLGNPLDNPLVWVLSFEVIR